jgi:hypothetical protein
MVDEEVALLTVDNHLYDLEGIERADVEVDTALSVAQDL